MYRYGNGASRSALKVDQLRSKSRLGWIQRFGIQFRRRDRKRQARVET